MSQYIVREDEEIKVVVGWDPPLQTFFVQVHDLTQDEEEQIILWEGTRPGEIASPWMVKEKIEEWFDLTPAQIRSLGDDKHGNR